MAVRSGAFSATPLVQRIVAGPWPATAALLVVAILSGTWSITGRALTFTPELLIPSAIGVPFGIPSLRAVPLGGTTWSFWLVDVAAVLVMAAILWTRLRHRTRRPFLAAWGATVLAVCAGNLVRIVFTSFVTHQGLGSYTLTVLLGLLVSALWGAVVGLLVGVVHLLDVRRRTREPSRRRAHSAHADSAGDSRELVDRGRAVSVPGDR
ncbi:hypothetical protein [Prescottella subtropica]|uniref:hypothetical protein n=1 Tax=Prescottella subtropica TaxID=2545757 RepID=UPI001F4F4667|nr:hypothetical protein [Prescottella subtropica]